MKQVFVGVLVLGWLLTSRFELASLKDKTALDPHPISISEFGIFWDLGLGWSIFFHVSFLTSMSLLYGRVLGTRLLGNRRFNVGLIFIKKNIKVGQKWRL